jgi:hypothetical protein
MNTQSDSDRDLVYTVMIHESAHAVIARLSRFHCLTNEIVIGQSTGEASLTIFPAKVLQEGFAVDNHLLRNPEVAMDACRVLVAGRQAEALAGGTPDVKDSAGDYDSAKEILKKAGLNAYALLPGIEAECRNTLEKFWPLVVGLADHIKASGKVVVPIGEVDDALDRLAKVMGLVS